MYPKYFGLKEPSFSIAPDPQYLFLSTQHKEALAHLLYGAGESGGFVLLTGEVGTGKTTVCRAFLEQLPEGVDVALILNPAQTATELLHNICDELRIPVPAGERSIKVLVDRLNQYLLEAHAKGRRPVLIIDEAQNLRPQVMEQIRLLTNLETTKHKLLQIFLIGQPELRGMLESERLRQLDQRITARFHLTPFDLGETGDYIRHRVAVAGVDRPLFTARAIKLIYRYSGGVPRLINILCDRALLGTCVTRGSQVTPAILLKAAREVRGDLDETRPAPMVRPVFLMAAAFVVAFGLGWWGYSWLDGEWGARLVSEAPPTEDPLLTEQESIVPVTDETPAAAPLEPVDTDSRPTPELERLSDAPAADTASAPVITELPSIALTSLEDGLLQTTLNRVSMPQSEALRLLLRHWGVEVEDLGRGDPCARLARFGLSCSEEQGRLSNVRFFDLPALMKVTTDSGAPRFLVLGALGEHEAILDLPSGRERLSTAGLERIWTGDYILVWQPPPGGATVIGAGSYGDDVRWLRQLVSGIPELGAALGDSLWFDAALANRVRLFQAAKGLETDGVAGPRTLIQLSLAAGIPGIPRLSKDSSVSETVVGTP